MGGNLIWEVEFSKTKNNYVGRKVILFGRESYLGGSYLGGFTVVVVGKGRNPDGFLSREAF